MKFLVALLVVASGSFWSINESVAQKTMEGSKTVESMQQDQRYIGLMFTKNGGGRKAAPHSPAEKAGFKAGDVVLQVDGEKVVAGDTLWKKILAKKIGDTLKLVVNRNGEQVKLSIVVGNRDDYAESTQTSIKKIQSGTSQFESADGLAVTMDVYAAHAASAPAIVLCHQAGWSRGEYKEIAPKLNKMGFNCFAIDQRSGKGVNKIVNETNKRAVAAGKGVAYPDAEQDIVAALKKVRDMTNSDKVILWGSSYSAALSLRIAGENPDLVDGVLAFAPGEYFGGSGKPKDWIATSAKKIKVPAFVTSAKNEFRNWKPIYEAIPGDSKAMFLPKTKGNHGSRALWNEFDDNEAYWTATTSFLSQFTAGESKKAMKAKMGSAKKGSSKK